MSKQSDQAAFARLVQTDLKARGFYAGPIDEWPGPGTQKAYAASVGLSLPKPPVVLDPSDHPEAQKVYTLPRETFDAMTAFYGTPLANPKNLAYFSFPCDGVRLYTRTGTLLVDRVNDDGLPDHMTHELLAGRLQSALAEIFLLLGETEFRKQGWHLYGGSHNYRKKVGGSGLSTHSWALSVDFNPSENPYAQTSTTFSPAAIDIMEKWGFLSGGRAWKKDWMHFQAAFPNLSSGSYYSIHGFPKHLHVA